MNTKILGVLGLLVIAAAIIWGLSKVPQRVPTETTEQDLLGGVATTSGDLAYSKHTDTYMVDVVYPSRTALQDSAADKAARATMQAGLKSQIDNFMTESVSLIDAEEAARIKERGTPYALGITYKTYSSESFVSYVYAVYLDTGGAHPNGFYTTFVFDQTGTNTEIKNLFAPGSDYLARLSAKARAGVVADLKGRFDGEGEPTIFEEGVTPVEANFQTFYLDKDALVLVFPPYQVAAYAAGTIEVRIPLVDLKDILLPTIK